MLFDPSGDRNGFLRDDRWLLKSDLGTVYDPSRPMGNVAISQIGNALSAWLVGLDKEIEPIIQPANSWLDKAIEDDEHFGDDINFHRARLHWARAIGAWMQHGWVDEGHWESTRVFLEASWRNEKRPIPANQIIRDYLDDYMAFSYLAGEDGCEAGVEMYERWVGGGALSLSRTLKPREFGYALCLHESNIQFEMDELLQAGRRMLQANLQEEWLGRGQYLCAATWLMAVYSKSGLELSPLQTVLRAYENMPKVPKPDFISVE